MGYTPLFDTLTKGTLCGRWPDIGLWPVVLSLTDKNGVVDCTPAYIAGVTGLALDDVIACMKRFCQPDPYSRTQDHNGARLELLDAHRDWGWRVVNHGKYREKARKAAYDSERTSSGKDADRKRHERESSRDVPRSPDESRALPLSDSNADSDSNAEKRGERARETPGVIDAGDGLTRLPEDLGHDAWRDVGCDESAMTAWIAHWSRSHGNREMPGHQRICAAKLLAGLGDAETQRRAVTTAEANGWKALRPGDGARAPPKQSTALSDRITWRPDPEEERRAQGVS